MSEGQHWPQNYRANSDQTALHCRRMSQRLWSQLTSRPRPGSAHSRSDMRRRCRTCPTSLTGAGQIHGKSCFLKLKVIPSMQSSTCTYQLYLCSWRAYSLIRSCGEFGGHRRSLDSECRCDATSDAASCCNQGCSTLSSWVGESEMPHADANRRRVAA